MTRVFDTIKIKKFHYGRHFLDIEEYAKAPYLTFNPFNTKRFVVHRYYNGRMTHYWWYRFGWMAKWRFHEEIVKILPEGPYR